MTLQRRITFWMIALCAMILSLWVFSPILLPFVAGMALAYVLDPVADRLEAIGMNRLWATITILLLFLLVLVLLLPVLGNQLASLIAALPDYVSQLQTLIVEHVGDQLRRVTGFGTDELKTSLGNLMTQGAGWLGNLLKSIWSGGQALMSIMALFLVTPVVAFYLLLDWDRMIAKAGSWLSLEHCDLIHKLVGQIDTAVAGFVRGQVSVCLILGTFYAVGLAVVGLKFGLLIGIGAGLISFIPYIGATTGFLMSLGVALVQFWPDWYIIFIVLAVFAAGQFLEGNIPILIGDRVGLHPVWLMFALFAFGYLFGFVGMMVAVPVSAAIGVLARFGLEQYLTSSFYYGVNPRSPAGDSEHDG
ncbi:AI-2E family transporter [Breoghania sp.]|uniref:AI-2E family transporter n=1 Tax=Breoghania sp. TaxID=2065378 RepID=UPI00261C3439|nr:AI-2E family transporter [Breoghania sp.]MDJ0929637.1 AI-2E family transporter [Breoghania sp.]